MTDKQKEAVIIAVQNEPCLWKMSDPVYKSVKLTARNEIWKRIGIELKIDGKIAWI
jgi:predicted ribosome-associated RNA-binding protein Tma20